LLRAHEILAAEAQELLGERPGEAAERRADRHGDRRRPPPQAVRAGIVAKVKAAAPGQPRR
jgi:hypothetical protein